MPNLRIAIVNDTLISREVMRRAILAEPNYQLAWMAENGAEAVERCRVDRPDILLMDLLMPVMDGVEATRQIMEQSPCAILLVTASVNRFARKVFEAMGHGALDAINTPILTANASQADYAGLLSKIAMIGKLLRKSPTAQSNTAQSRTAQSNTAPPQRSQHRSPPQTSPPRTQAPSTSPRLVPAPPPLLLIGASTGGPQAIATILSQIPATTPMAIIIIQHIDAQFALGLAEWLNQQSHLPVQLAQSGEPVQAGRVAIAGRDRHLVISRSGTLNYQTNRANLTYCPSIDICFRSAADHWPAPGIGVLLTGMGRDGAVGLKSLADAGWLTIAQDQATSVVYGMPKAAIELQPSHQILPIADIASACIAQFTLKSLKKS
jgi:two-component system, chemotaxis family, response regulator WspF